METSTAEADDGAAFGPGYTRRRFLGTAALAGTGLALTQFSSRALAAPDALLTRSVTEIAAMLQNGKIGSLDLVKACYARIDEVNPTINAVVMQCRERAFAEAAEADAQMAAGMSLGPLHGVPFTIKDSFDTVGVVSTGGTLGRKDFIPGEDATVVARLRAAGGILLGKTNTPEFTLGGGARGTYNLIYGQTRNPYNTAYTPSGSSGGAGAIVASCGSFFDVGTDYGGSIRGPSNVNGITGIKPTLGRVPRTGHIVGYGGPYDSFQEVGPMARHVGDLALLLPILAGPDDRDAAMAPVPLGNPADVDLKSLRVAYYTSNGVTDPSDEIQAMVERCAGYFSKLGCKLKSDMPPRMQALSDARRAFSGASGGDNRRRMLEKYGTKQASPGLNIGGETISSAEFTAACEEMDAIKSEQLAWFEQYDLILCPSSATAPDKIPPEFVRPRGRRGLSYNSQYNTTGWPAGVVRAGTSEDAPGLPLGIQVVAQPWRDDVALAAMAHIEGKAGGWQMPPI
ncbi:MAG: amidase [Gammaproteobacteria bacterium]|nr:amidase [Gammaproteobacteria bacterium]